MLDMTHATAKSLITGALAAASMALVAIPAQAGKTIDAIKARGQLVCGVNTGLAGFSVADSQGNWSGLDVDVCKAIAASLLGDATRSSTCR
jgi:general L-amino acid transport system substrate-binding protein